MNRICCKLDYFTHSRGCSPSSSLPQRTSIGLSLLVVLPRFDCGGILHSLQETLLGEKNQGDAVVPGEDLLRGRAKSSVSLPDLPASESDSVSDAEELEKDPEKKLEMSSKTNPQKTKKGWGVETEAKREEPASQHGVLYHIPNGPQLFQFFFGLFVQQTIFFFYARRCRRPGALGWGLVSNH